MIAPLIKRLNMDAVAINFARWDFVLLIRGS
jgi:hypothetical protein